MRPTKIGRGNPHKRSRGKRLPYVGLVLFSGPVTISALKLEESAIFIFLQKRFLAPRRNRLRRQQRQEILTLSQIAEEIALCTRCALHKTRQKAVPGEGPVDARMMLIGEAPGREEDLQGRPFVGRSGRILDEILAEAGFQRKELFITSVVKCRPPNNRMPKNLEQETCLSSHTLHQMQIISPKIICLLGGVAAKAFLGIKRVSEKRGRIFEKTGYRFFPTYHPAAAGRSRAWYQGLSQDMIRLRELLESFY